MKAAQKAGVAFGSPAVPGPPTLPVVKLPPAKKVVDPPVKILQKSEDRVIEKVQAKMVGKTTAQARNEAMDRTILVCYFPREADRSSLHNTFSKYGTVESVNRVEDPVTKQPKCYGFVRFAE